MKKKWGWLVVTFFVAQTALAHAPLLRIPIPRVSPTKPKMLTLNDAILLALRSNPDIQSAELTRVSDKFALEVAHNEFEPRYTLTGTATYAKDAMPQYGLDSSVSLTTTAGTRIETDFKEQVYGGEGIQPSVDLTITQPLLRGTGDTVVKSGLLNAIDTERTQKLALKNTIITTINTVISNYYTVVESVGQLETAQESLKLSQQTYKQTSLQINAGQVAPRELVTQASTIAQDKIDITSAKNTVQSGMQTLLQTLGLDPQSKVTIDKTLDLKKITVPDLERSQQIALTNNITYQTALIDIKAAERAVIVQQDQQRWELDAVATGGFPNDGLIRLRGEGPPGADSSYSLTLNLSVPINDLSRQKDLVDAKIDLQKDRIALANTRRTTISTVINDVRELATDLALLKQQEAALKLANESYELEVMKFKKGLSSYVNVSTQQSAANTARNSLISQRVTYLNDKATYEGDLGITLRRWKIIVRY